MSADRFIELELERRLAVLERQRRWSAVVAAVSLIALVIGFQMTMTEAQTSASIRAPFRVLNSAGQEVFAINQVGNDTRVTISHKGAVVSTWSAGDESAMLSLGNAQSKGVVRLGMDFLGSDTGPSMLLSDGTHDLLNVDNNSVDIDAPLTVSPKDIPILKVEQNLVTVGEALNVKASKGGNRVSIAPNNVSVHGGDGVSVAATLGLDATGKGRLVVGTQGSRGVLGTAADGAISLQVTDGKGSAQLRAAAGRSSVRVVNNAGYGVVSLENTAAGNGMITVGSDAGDTLVTVGISTDNVGVVRTGPIGGRGYNNPPTELNGRLK